MATEDIPEREHVFIRGEGGSVFKLDLPLHEDIEQRLLKGYLVRVANAEGDPYVEGGAETPSLPTKRPALKAAKSEWVGWAVVNGMTPDDAEALTVTDLIEKFGQKAPETTPAPDGTPGAPTGEPEQPGDGDQTPAGDSPETPAAPDAE